ncbi:MAG: carbon-nitrogen hydrolase family protein [Sphingomonadaceae bacterium]|nr:carbon-nitrogen hydrolase family protein [Sphingomonadaceae bacterium]
MSVAAIQAAPMLFDRRESEARFTHWLGRAREAGIELAVFPEAFLGGYPKGVDFGTRVGSRDAEGRELFRRYAETAYAKDGDDFARICGLVADAGLTVVTGLIERLGGTLYCVAATIGPDGALLGWHRKLVPTAMERLIWGQGDGSTMAAADTAAGKVSTAICWENYMPHFRAHLYNQGTQIYAAPTVDDREAWSPTMQMIAIEGRCFVVSACQYMLRGDVAGDGYDAIQGNDPDTLLIGGGSMIVSPMGEVLAGPLRGAAGMVEAEIDLDDIVRAQFDRDVAGHYARPDIFRVETDTSSRLYNG